MRVGILAGTNRFLDDEMPVAPPGGRNVLWQADGLNISAYVPDIEVTGDLAGDATGQTVVGIRGSAVADTAPAECDLLCYSADREQWEPTRNLKLLDVRTDAATFVDPTRIVFGSGWQAWVPQLLVSGGLTVTDFVVEYAQWLRIGPLAFISLSVSMTLGGTLTGSFTLSIPTPVVGDLFNHSCATYAARYKQTPLPPQVWAGFVRGSVFQVAEPDGKFTAGAWTYAANGFYRCA